MTYELINNRCTCHPETCNCAAYIITKDGERVARGNDYVLLSTLVAAANRGEKK